MAQEPITRIQPKGAAEPIPVADADLRADLDAQTSDDYQAVIVRDAQGRLRSISKDQFIDWLFHGQTFYTE